DPGVLEVRDLSLVPLLGFLKSTRDVSFRLPYSTADLRFVETVPLPISRVEFPYGSRISDLSPLLTHPEIATLSLRACRQLQGIGQLGQISRLRTLDLSESGIKSLKGVCASNELFSLT